jgi:glucose-1-phosphate thymidylyltransferase
MKGVVLAAGEGSRIRRVTYGAFPKELLPIGNVPTIRFPLEALRLAKIESVLIVIAPQTKHSIVDGLQSGRKFGMEIYYGIQERGKNLYSGVGAAILAAKSWAGNEGFVVALGDTIICDFSSSNPLDCLKPLMNVHRKNDSIATVLVYPTNSDPRRFGLVKFRSFREENGTMFGEVECMVEKPDASVAKSFKANGYYYAVAGYYVFKPSIFSYIEKTKLGARNEIQITDTMQLAIENGKRVDAVVHAECKNGNLFPREYWDVGIPRDYKEANIRLLDENIDKWLSSGE